MVQILKTIWTLGYVFLLLVPTWAIQYNQKASLFTGSSGTGSFTNVIETYFPDLQTLNFNNKVSSTCVTGIWLFYDQQNFNPSNALMEYVFGPSNFCVDFQNLAGKVSSVRFAGSPKDYRTDTITLYLNTYFQGEEEYTYVDLPSLHLDKATASLIVTGSSPWTLYDGLNFSGNAVCVYPPSSNNFTPALIFDTTTLSVPHGSIRSVKKGCYGRQVFVKNLSRGRLVNLTQIE